MARPSVSVVTPYHSPRGANVFQFVLSVHSEPSVASYSASSAARSVAMLPCASARGASPVPRNTAGTGGARRGSTGAGNPPSGPSGGRSASSHPRPGMGSPSGGRRDGSIWLTVCSPPPGRPDAVGRLGRPHRAHDHLAVHHQGHRPHLDLGQRARQRIATREGRSHALTRPVNDASSNRFNVSTPTGAAVAPGRAGADRVSCPRSTATRRRRRVMESAAVSIPSPAATPVGATARKRPRGCATASSADTTASSMPANTADRHPLRTGDAHPAFSLADTPSSVRLAGDSATGRLFSNHQLSALREEDEQEAAHDGEVLQEIDGAEVGVHAEGFSHEHGDGNEKQQLPCRGAVRPSAQGEEGAAHDFHEPSHDRQQRRERQADLGDVARRVLNVDELVVAGEQEDRSQHDARSDF